jgi:hypothetical protein
VNQFTTKKVFLVEISHIFRSHKHIEAFEGKNSLFSTVSSNTLTSFRKKLFPFFFYNEFTTGSIKDSFYFSRSPRFEIFIVNFFLQLQTQGKLLKSSSVVLFKCLSNKKLLKDKRKLCNGLVTMEGKISMEIKKKMEEKKDLLSDENCFKCILHEN